MLHWVFLLGALAAPPFWEAKPPVEWNALEIEQMLADSPWAQTATQPRAPGVQVFLASARPVREAEAERARRKKIPRDSEGEIEYAEYLATNEGKVIVLALAIPDPMALANAAEARAFEEESRLRAGRKKFKMEGHFPPAGEDPYLRLAFPRPDLQGLKELVFELYVPGVPAPYRTAVFELKRLVYRGALEL